MIKMNRIVDKDDLVDCGIPNEEAQQIVNKGAAQANIDSVKGISPRASEIAQAQFGGSWIVQELNFSEPGVGEINSAISVWHDRTTDLIIVHTTLSDDIAVTEKDVGVILMMIEALQRHMDSNITVKGWLISKSISYGGRLALSRVGNRVQWFNL